MRNAEYLDSLNEKEAELVPETDFDSSTVRAMALDKLNMRPKNRRMKTVVLAAALICVFSMVTVAAAGEFDVQFSRLLGLSSVMESLEDGYMRIDRTCEDRGTKVTVSKSIGDKYSQWIQIDTDIPWEAGEDQYYMFSDIGFYVYRAPLTVRIEENRMKGPGQQFVRPLSGGSHLWGFENNGFVSFMIYAMDYENLSSAIVEFKAEGIVLYDNEGRDIKKYEGSFEFMWRNCYEENIRKGETGVLKAEDSEGNKVKVKINSLEISPVSVRISGRAYTKADIPLEIEYFVLGDGKRIAGVQTTAQGHGSFGCAEWFYSLENMVKSGSVNGNEIAAVVIGGKTFKVK